jgi:hypothetical protein
MNAFLNHHFLFAGAVCTLITALAACGNSSDSNDTQTDSGAAGQGTGGSGGQTTDGSGGQTTDGAAGACYQVGADASEDSPALATLVSEVTSKFKQFEYADPDTGKTLPYNLYIPDNYTSSKSYPMVLYIADSSLVGGSVTAPLSQYGALIWGSSVEQVSMKASCSCPSFRR